MTTSGHRPAPSAAFDRITPPERRLRRERDGLGKEALYSTAPSAAPTTQVELHCRRCDVPFGLSVLGACKLLRPPFLLDPLHRRVWARCPACQRHAWIDVATGQALRVLRGPRRG